MDSKLINSISDLSRNRIVESQISRLNVYCPNRLTLTSENIIKDETTNGCKLITTIDEIDNHLKECQHKLIECKYKECGHLIRQNHQDDHYEFYCNFSVLKCNYCSSEQSFNRNDLTLHYDSCPDIIINCIQYNVYLKRNEINDHLNNQCSESIVQCTYFHYGCVELIKRNELSNHLRNNDHDKMISAVFEELERSKRNCNKLLDERDEMKSKVLQFQTKYIEVSNLFDESRKVKSYNDNFSISIETSLPSSKESTIKLNNNHHQFQLKFIDKDGLLMVGYLIKIHFNISIGILKDLKTLNIFK